MMKNQKPRFLQLAAWIGMTCSLGLACASANAAITQEQYDTMLASALKTMVLACRYPQVKEPTTTAEAEALKKSGQEFVGCVKEHDKLRIQYHNMEVTPNNALASKLSGPQIDAYRAALKTAIQVDVDKNRSMIHATLGDVNSALQSYAIKSRPDVPQNIFDPMLARLDRYKFSCPFPSVPYSVSQSERAAFDEKLNRLHSCDDEWITRANDVNKRGVAALVTEAEFNALSIAQRKELFDRLVETMTARMKQRDAQWHAFKTALAEMSERAERRNAELEKNR